MDTLYQAPHSSPSRTLCTAPSLSSLPHYIGFEPCSDWLFSRDPTETLGRPEVEHSIRCISTSMFPRRPGPLASNPMIQWRKDFLLVPTGRICSRQGNFMIGTVLGDATSGVFGIGRAEAVVRFSVSEDRGDACFFSWVRDNGPNGMQVGNAGRKVNSEDSWRYAIVTYVTVIDLCHRQREMILFDLKEGGGVHRATAKQRIATIEVRDCPICHSAAGVCFCSKLKNLMLPIEAYRETNREIREILRPPNSQLARARRDPSQIPHGAVGLPRLYALLSGIYQGNVNMFEFDRNKKGEMVRAFSTHVVSSGELGDDTTKLKTRLVTEFVRKNYNPASGAGFGREMVQSMMEVVENQSIEAERQKLIECQQNANATAHPTEDANRNGVPGALQQPTSGSTSIFTNAATPVSVLGGVAPRGSNRLAQRLQPRSGRANAPVLDRITKEKMRVLRNRERAQISNEKRRARIKAMELQLTNSKATVNLLLEMTIALHKENDRLRQHIECAGLPPVDAQSNFDLVVRQDYHSQRRAVEVSSTHATEPYSEQDTRRQ